jgi:ATP-dependent Clp protease ATP-binding subunit ClpA
MFERFTDRARQAVVLAQEEARALNHNYIGTEHILLGLLRDADSVAGVALRRLGIGRDAVRIDIEQLIGRGSDTPSGHIPFTPRSKKVLELSLREALKLGHNYIGTEHILLGLVREGEGVAAQLLVERGGDLDRVRATVLAELRGLGGEARAAGRRRTPAAEEAVAIAEALADRAPVGSHHLLEALARTEHSVAAKVLAALGLDADAIAAKIDDVGLEGTSDATTEETAARQMEVRLEEDAVHVVLRDAATVELVRSITEPLGGPVRGDDPAAGSLAGMWQPIVASLEELRRRLSPPIDEGETTGSSRSALVRRAIQNRVARRRPRRPN